MCTYQLKLFNFWALLSLLIIFLLPGCATTPTTTLPPIDESKPSIPDTTTTYPSFPPSTTPVSCGSYHTVVRGETLYGIATRCGLNYQDVARWNNIAPPYALNPGQPLTLFGSATGTLPSTNPGSGSYNSGVYHTVVAGDTLFNISQRYKCTVSDLKAWNGLSSDSLSLGQQLRVSSPNGSSNSPASYIPSNTAKNVSPADTAFNNKNVGQYVVQTVDTVYSVAKLYGYTVADVAAWNHLQPPYNLVPGQVLIVTPPSASAVTAQPKSSVSVSNTDTTTAPDTTTVPDTSGSVHTVVPGDTLFSIAKHYGNTVESIKQWNGLSSNQLTVGQQLRVSGTAVKAAAVKKATTVAQAKPSKKQPTASFSPPPLRYKKYQVSKGETLYRIATKHGLTESELANANGIGPPYTVYPGQELTIIPKR